MSRFNSNPDTGNPADGSINILGLTVSATNLRGNFPVKTDASGKLVSSLIEPADINGNVLVNPFIGTIVASNFESDDYFSVNTELQKIDNLQASIALPIPETTINGNLIADDIFTDNLTDKTGSVFIQMDATDIDLLATNLTFNGNPILTSDQTLNTTDDVQFNSVQADRLLSIAKGVTYSPIEANNVKIWADTDGRLFANYQNTPLGNVSQNILYNTDLIPLNLKTQYITPGVNSTSFSGGIDVGALSCTSVASAGNVSGATITSAGDLNCGNIYPAANDTYNIGSGSFGRFVSLSLSERIIINNTTVEDNGFIEVNNTATNTTPNGRKFQLHNKANGAAVGNTFQLRRVADNNFVYVDPIVEFNAISYVAKFGGSVQLKSYTTAALPASSASSIGSTAYCSDIIAGGLPVFDNGTNWVRYDSASTLQNVYDNSTGEPEILTNATQGAITVRQGVSDSNNTMEFQNVAGTTTARISGTGNITCGGVAPNSSDTFDLGQGGLRYLNGYIKSISSFSNNAATYEVLATSNVFSGAVSNKSRFKMLNSVLPSQNTLSIVDTDDFNGSVSPILTMEHTTGNVVVNKGDLNTNAIIPATANVSDIGMASKIYRTVYANSLSLTYRMTVNDSIYASHCFIDVSSAYSGSMPGKRRFKFCNISNGSTVGNTLRIMTSSDNGGIEVPLLSFDAPTGSVTVDTGDLNTNAIIPRTTNVSDIGSTSKRFDNIYSNGISLQTTGGTSTELNYYETITIASTWGGIWSTPQAGNIMLTRIGNVVHCCVCSVLANANTSGGALLTVAMPARFRPGLTYVTPAPVRDNSSGNPQPMGIFEVRSTGIIAVWKCVSISDTIGNFSGLSNVGHSGWLNINLTWQVA